MNPCTWSRLWAITPYLIRPYCFGWPWLLKSQPAIRAKLFELRYTGDRVKYLSARSACAIPVHVYIEGSQWSEYQCLSDIIGAVHQPLLVVERGTVLPIDEVFDEQFQQH